MRTHPPAFVQAIASRLRLSRAVSSSSVRRIHFPSVRASPSRLCAILLRHRASSAWHHHVCASPAYRAPSRHRAPSRATAPPCFFFFSVAHCARDELAQSAPFQVSCTIACYGAPLLLLQRRLRAHGLRSLCRSRHHAPLCATAPPASSSSASPIAAQAKFIYLRADGQPSIIFAPTGDYQYLSRRRAQ